MPLVLVLTIIVVVEYFPFPAAAKEHCIKDYHELESDMLANPLNIDSLVMSFFSPNGPSLPVLEVFYRVYNSSDPDQHQLVSSIVGANKTEEPVLAEYHYRWSKSPIFLFLEPIVLQRLALNTFRIQHKSVNLVVSPVCDYTINDVPLLVHYLNQMTSLVSVIIICMCMGLFFVYLYSYLRMCNFMNCITDHYCYPTLKLCNGKFLHFNVKHWLFLVNFCRYYNYYCLKCYSK